MKSKVPVGFIVAAIVVLVASFMPWGSFEGGVSTPFGGGMFPGGSPFGGARMTFTINAWNGSVTLQGVSIPNWVAVVAAAAIAVIAALRAYGTWEAHPAVNIALALYGIAHVGLTVLILGSKGSVGIGSILTLICFVGLLVLSIKAARESRSSQGTAPEGR